MGYFKMATGLFRANTSIPSKATTPIFKKDIVALEERSDGRTEDEHELVFYAKLDDVSRLNQLQYEDQEQWTYRFNSFNGFSVQNRVRKTTSGDNTEYTHTVKTIKFGEAQTPVYNECSIEASSDLFEMYKTISEKGMNKRRFFMPIVVNKKEYVFEIDVFRSGEDTFFDWVKIDLEMDPENINVTDWVKHLPDYLTDIIDYRNATPEQEKQVTDLYDSVFLTKNTK